MRRRFATEERQMDTDKRNPWNGFLICIHRFSSVAKVVLIFVGLLAGGCGALGLAAAKLGPPETVPAQFKLANVPTLIMVENYEDPAPSLSESERVAKYIGIDLHGEDVPEKERVPLIATTKISDLRSAQPAAFAKMKVSDIGAAVGAEQVIYVDLQYAAVETMTGSQILRGRADGKVKVIDCKTGLTLWPQESAGGIPVAFSTNLKRLAEEGATAESIKDDTLDGFARRVGRLFHKWKVEDTDK